jgi:hypothetical protein
LRARHQLNSEATKYIALSDAASGQTIYVNLTTIRYVIAAGHRTLLVFSETHVITVTADLQSVMASEVFTQ